MVRDAEKFAADDVKKKEEVEVINQADNLIYVPKNRLKIMEIRFHRLSGRISKRRRMTLRPRLKIRILIG